MRGRSNGALPGQDERATETLPLPKRSDGPKSITATRAWARLQRRIAWRHREIARIQDEIAVLEAERDALTCRAPKRDEVTR